MRWTNLSRSLVAVAAAITLSHCSVDTPVAEAKQKPRKTSPRSALPGGEESSRPTASTESTPATSLASTVPISIAQQPTPPILPKPDKKIEGAVVENLGPCHGRGVAGEATINGKTEYVCGDGTRDIYSSDPYGAYPSRGGYNTGGGYRTGSGSSNYRSSSRRRSTYRP